MAGPVGQDQAVAVLAQCREDVRGDLPGALLISGQVPVDGRHAARADSNLSFGVRAQRRRLTCAAPRAFAFSWYNRS